MIVPETMQRDAPLRPTIVEACTSCACDVVGSACALPCLACGSCTQCGPYAQRAPPRRAGVRRLGVTDRWYRAAVHTLHGGSLLQLVATHSLLWRFPQDADGDMLRVEVEPRTACGDGFARAVRCAAPRFRVHRIEPDLWSVRLTLTPPCCAPVDLSASTLNDVWRVAADGRTIHSIKTRGYQTSCGGATTGCATGPALFVEAAPEPSIEDREKGCQCPS